MALEDEFSRLVGVQYAIGEEQRNSYRKNKEGGLKQEQCSVMDMCGGESKSQCCKEKHCIGSWHVMSMSQGKLDIVKEEMARMNIDILGISELKWTGLGEFNSDDHYIYYCRQKLLRRNGVSFIVNERSRSELLGCSQKC